MPTSAPTPSHTGSSHANPGVPRAAVKIATTVETIAAITNVNSTTRPMT